MRSSRGIEGGNCCTKRCPIRYARGTGQLRVRPRATLKDDIQVSKRKRQLLEIGETNLLYNLDGSCKEVAKDEGAVQRRADRLVDVVKGVFLPRGYPHTVSQDYLAYQLWTIPTHVTGWVGNSLVTSSLLRAVGLGSGAVKATAATAAIKWITKDGVGALGRLLVGGRLGDVFDEDPRRWRMAGELVSTIGLSLEIATAFFPSQFLLLAGAGNFTKALAKGMAKPSFRVIQQHFARGNNVGEVAAKEESWEVLGQTIGLLTSVLLLSSMEDAGSWETVLIVWMITQAAHVVLRFEALSALALDTINISRGKRLTRIHIQNQPIPAVPVINREEAFLVDWMTLEPFVHFGCTLQEAVGGTIWERDLEKWVGLFECENYLLSVKNGEGWVVLKEAAGGRDVLRALWQCMWLVENGVDNCSEDDLASSIRALNLNFAGFESALHGAGWNTDQVAIIQKGTRVREIDCFD